MDLANHPCFNKNSRLIYGRVHLPVASRCNVQCRFCNRKFDCANESRPGVTSALLSPVQSVQYLDRMLNTDSRIKVVGIAGPGDAFAQPETSLEVLERVRKRYPEMLLCVATNGLNLLPCIKELSRLKISHVTITINAVDPGIGKDIYAWIRHGKKVQRGTKAAEILLENQKNSLRELKKNNIIVKINSIVLPGINDMHTVEVARTVASWGADFFNAIPLHPAQGSDFAHLGEPSLQRMNDIRKRAEVFIAQMEHCGRCRADAAGLIGEKQTKEVSGLLLEHSRIRPTALKPAVAVATREELFVNLHLGEAVKLSVFVCGKDGEYHKLDERKTPPAGLGTERWNKLAEIFSDCCAVMVSGIGETPGKVLESSGLSVLHMSGLIEDGLDYIYKEAKKPPKPLSMGCGTACSGNGGGCM
ncbi:MAG: radical SAM protein [Chitinispirillaceae bacterium]